MTSPPARSSLSDALAGLLTPGPRLVDEFECVASILLAIAFAHLVGAKTVCWAAFTALVLMRGHVSETLVRGVMRMVGTAAGAGLALLVVPFAAGSVAGAVAAAAVIGTGAMYATLTAKRSYAWLLLGLTYEMILLDKLDHPQVDALEFAETRLLEVAAGTAACLIVSLLSTLTARRRWPGPAPAPAQRIGWHPHAARHAAQTGVALAFLPLLAIYTEVPELWQAAVTVMAVMMVPVSSIGTSGLVPVSRKLMLRTVGCIAGGLLAGGVLVASQGWVPGLIAGTCIGVILGRHVENGQGGLAYLGLQFTLAVLVVLVPDSYAQVSLVPAMERLVSIFVGMGALVPVLVVWHLLGAGERAASTA